MFGHKALLTKAGLSALGLLGALGAHWALQTKSDNFASKIKWSYKIP